VVVADRSTTTGAPLVIIGLDGATLDLVEPWAAEGHLPNLAALMKGGVWGPLRSTLPPATFPAWTSFMTGANPGRHGIFDFTARIPGTYRVRFVNSTFRAIPSLWRVLSDADRQIAVVAMPGTYPPEAVRGVMVSGFDAPVARTIDGSFVWPRQAYREVRAVAGRLPFADVQEVDIGPTWPEEAVPRLLDGIGRKTALMQTWLRQKRWDCVCIVFGESDTIAHHCWQFHDPRSPRFEASPHASAIWTIYRRLDQAIGEIMAAAPPGASILVVSDHGSGGASDVAVHINAYLRDLGLLAFEPRGVLGALAGVGKRAALRWCPPPIQEFIFRRAGWAASRMESAARFAGIAWTKTVAFSEELDYAPTVWLNVRGREPCGTVTPAEYERVRDRVCAALEAWRDPWRGDRIIRRAYRREEIYHGPAVDRAPDIILDLELRDGYSYSCLSSLGGQRPAIRKLSRQECAGGRGRGLNGTHRHDGLFVASAGIFPGIGRIDGVGIADLAPTLLALLGIEIPGFMDGRVVEAMLREGIVVRRAGAVASDEGPPQGERPYDAAEERDVARRLAALGYLDGPL